MNRPSLGWAAVMFVAGLAWPATAHADAAGPTDYEAEIVAVSPSVDGLEVAIEGGDSFVRLVAPRGSEVVVLGYVGEPYLRFGPEGDVSQNLRSAATYENRERYGGVDLPDVVDPDALPEWEVVATGGSWAWHDHRSHWMGTVPPVGLDPGEPLPVQTIPLEVDGSRVSIEVQTTLQPPPSGLAAGAGLLAGLLLVIVGRALGPATTTLVTLAVAVAATVVGGAQFLSLPSETGPLWSWWALPLVAVAAGIATIVGYGRSPLLVHGLHALAAFQLGMWAWLRRDGLTKPVLPTDLPFWLDRSVTAAALVVGVVGLVGAVWTLATISSPAPRRSPS